MLPSQCLLTTQPLAAKRIPLPKQPIVPRLWYTDLGSTIPEQWGQENGRQVLIASGGIVAPQYGQLLFEFVIR
jgi:hypothetical protein